MQTDYRRRFSFYSRMAGNGVSHHESGNLGNGEYSFLEKSCSMDGRKEGKMGGSMAANVMPPFQNGSLGNGDPSIRLPSGLSEEWMEGQMGLMDIISGFIASVSVRAVVLLRVPDILSRSKGLALSAEEIASELPAQSPRVDFLCRILKFLATRRVFSETQHVKENGQKVLKYGLTGMSKLLVQDNNPVSMAPMFVLQANKAWQAPFHHIHESVLEGCDAFVRANGKDPWALARDDPEFNSGIMAAMAANTKLGIRQIMGFYDGFRDLKCLVDVGGGNGEALRAIVAAYPHLSAINFDLPHVVAAANSIPGVEHVGGNMFESVPSADGIFIKNVLHNWNDDQCRVILRNCHRALPENGKIILAEAVMGDEEEGEGKQSAKSPWDSLKLAYILLMIALFGGAVERSRKQWEDLLTACGFCGVKIHDGGVEGPISIIEAYKTT